MTDKLDSRLRENGTIAWTTFAGGALSLMPLAASATACQPLVSAGASSNPRAEWLTRTYIDEIQEPWIISSKEMDAIREIRARGVMPEEDGPMPVPR